MSDLKPKVLVIGASGALGKAVCDVFSARHWNVLRGLRTPDGQPDSVYVDLEMNSRSPRPWLAWTSW